MAQNESGKLTSKELKGFASKVIKNLPKDIDPEKVRRWLNEKNRCLWSPPKSLYSVLCKALIPMPKASTVPVQIEVDYSVSLPDMALRGNYKSHDIDRVIQRYFPECWPNPVKKVSISVEMKFFDQIVWPEDVLYALQRSRYRSLNLPELLALGAQHQELQTKYPIAAFGSPCVMSYNGDSKTFYPTLDAIDENRRFLFWAHPFEGWHHSYGFAATRLHLTVKNS